MDKIEKMLMKLPVVFDWYKYKGEDVFVGINYQATERTNRPMVDIFYCATQALNHNVLKTVQWDKKNFKPSKISNL